MNKRRILYKGEYWIAYLPVRNTLIPELKRCNPEVMVKLVKFGSNTTIYVKLDELGLD